MFSFIFSAKKKKVIIIVRVLCNNSESALRIKLLFLNFNIGSLKIKLYRLKQKQKKKYLTFKHWYPISVCNHNGQKTFNAANIGNTNVQVLLYLFQMIPFILYSTYVSGKGNTVFIKVYMYLYCIY